MVAKEFNNVLEVEDDEAEETLSLCDLAINSSTEDYTNCKDDEFSIEDQQELSSSSEDFFQFSSEEYSTSSTNNYPTDDIMFCGKLIPHKQHHVPEQTRIINDAVLKQQKLLHKKMSIINYKPLPCGKSRWYLFVFGYGRFPSEMELRDIKNRQSRRMNNVNAASTMFRFNGNNGGDQMSDKRSHKKRLWRLFRVLGCKNLKANAVAKASFSLRSACF